MQRTRNQRASHQQGFVRAADAGRSAASHCLKKDGLSCGANPNLEIFMQWFYLIAAIVGAILPLSQVIPFLITYGLDLPLFFRQLFQNHVSAFFGMDVIVSSLVLWMFVFSEGRRCRMKNLWLYVVCNLMVGVSLALPLFLFFRQRAVNTGRNA
jgi:hypothetical protein